MSFDKVKSNIKQQIKNNNNQEITGNILQTVLLNILNNLGLNASFAGIANKNTTPQTNDGTIYYITCEPGIYSNFNSIEIYPGELAILTNNDGNWKKQIINSYLNINLTDVKNYEELNSFLDSYIIDSIKKQGLFNISVGGVNIQCHIIYSGKLNNSHVITMSLSGSIELIDNKIVQNSNTYNIIYRIYSNNKWSNWKKLN